MTLITGIVLEMANFLLDFVQIMSSYQTVLFHLCTDQLKSGSTALLFFSFNAINRTSKQFFFKVQMQKWIKKLKFLNRIMLGKQTKYRKRERSVNTSPILREHIVSPSQQNVRIPHTEFASIEKFTYTEKGFIKQIKKQN